MNTRIRMEQEAYSEENTDTREDCLRRRERL
jgi:hypothetical protein